MGGTTLLALIEEGKAINADTAEAMKRGGLANTSLQQIKDWRARAATAISVKDPALGAQVPLIEFPFETEDIVQSLARIQAMLESLSKAVGDRKVGTDGTPPGFLELLPKNPVARKALLIVAGAVVLLFAVWSSLPDDRKAKVIDQVQIPGTSKNSAPEVKSAVQEPETISKK